MFLSTLISGPWIHLQCVSAQSKEQGSCTNSNSAFVSWRPMLSTVADLKQKQRFFLHGWAWLYRVGLDIVLVDSYSY